MLFLKRNGRNLDGNSRHIRFNSAGFINVTGCISRHGQDDDGTGNDAPAIWARESGTSGDITFVGNDLSGTTATQPMTLGSLWAGNLPAGYAFSNNTGLLMDERSSGRPVVQSGFPYQDLQNINQPANSTGTIQFVHDPVPAYSGITHKLRVTARNQNTGVMASAEFIHSDPARGRRANHHAVGGVRNHRHRRHHRLRPRHAAAELDRHRRRCLDLYPQRPEHQHSDPVHHRPTLLSGALASGP